ncbi:MAG TPA: adenylate/guanylate cyclase domain-containing protein [Dehalococcoidia bacterium]|nr:adenylate/guanylate cyclase domain-containing protein [Dehalococcoidia bacterium]
MFRSISRRQRRILFGTLLCLVVAVLYSAFVWVIEPFTDTQLSIVDRLYSDRDANSNIVVAEIDDASLEELGRFEEWSREEHAAAVDNLSEAGARAIVFDLLFIEPAPGDEELARAIGDAGNVVLSVAGENPIDVERDGPLVFGQTLEPNDSLSDRAAAVGHVNFPADGDGTVRRVPIAIQSPDGETESALSLATLLAIFGQPTPDLSGTSDVTAAEREIPVDDRKRMQINYGGEPDRFTTISYADLVNDDFEPDAVRNKAVLIGVTFTGAGDVHRAPNSAGGLIPGIFLQASALDTMLSGDFLENESVAESLLIFLGLAAILAFFLPREPIWVGTTLAVALILGHEVVGFFLFDQGTVVNFVWAPVGLALVYVTGLGQRIWFEREHRREVNELFGRYVSPQIASAIIARADQGSLETEGEEREVSVLFADLRGFTTLSEQLPPETMMRILNQCFEVIVERINAYGGIVTKFGGDAIMAIWNAPQDQPDHAASACLAASESLTRLEPFYSTSELQGAKFGFGVNTGKAVAGNLGSRGRSEYTLIGDAVNVASRLCGAAEGGECWIGERTHELAGTRINVEKLPPLTLKGKAEPVQAYRILGAKEPEPAPDPVPAPAPAR